MKIVDFKYRGEFSFFEYRYECDRQRIDILPPSSETTLKQVRLKNKGEYSLNELVTFKNQRCIIMIASPFKGVIWNADALSQYRARCYTKIDIYNPKNILLKKLDDIEEEMWIVQGNFETIDFVKTRAEYKTWSTEKQVQAKLKKEKPLYIQKYSGNWSILDGNSEVTIVNMTDAGWWFQADSYAPWYNPYVLTWKNTGYNVLSWRTAITEPFAFGFNTSPKETADEMKKLIKENFPKTRKVHFFGQCLGTPKAIQTAYEYGADSLYTTSTIFNPLRHRSAHLMELSGCKNYDAIEYIKENNNSVPSCLVYKVGDGEERAEHGRFLYEIGKDPNIQHNIVKYLDVWAPVLSAKPYSIFNFHKNDLPNTKIDLEFFEKNTKRFKHG